MAFGRSVLFVLWSVLTFSPADVFAATVPVVDLGYARYSGTFDQTTKTTQFLGMRFAAPPTGTLRWQAPQSPATTPGIQKAETEPAHCFFAGQGNAPATPFRENKSRKRNPFFASEDCLFLNVYLPGQLSQSKPLPVVIWIHGGGYMSGSASGFNGADIYDGKDLIRESNNGVVVVVIQYRLGVFGFLPGKEVKKNGALNAGLLDQQFAFQWVQKNIRKFNGDPTQVTLWGQSAGAGSVLQHVVANGGKTSPPLFRAAITSSSFLPSQYGYGDRIPEILYNEVVSQTNCSSASNTLACLRTVDALTLEGVNGDVGNSGFFGTFVFVPVVDGEFIRERPTEALKQRKVNGDILLTVTNAFEGALFIDPTNSPNVDVRNYVAQLFPDFKTKEIAAAAAQYQNVGSPIFQITAIMGEAIFICPTYFLLRAFGGRGFKSEFAIPPGGHGNDVAYYFPLGNAPPFSNLAFDKAFSESFLDFAMALNPNVKWNSSNITPKWELWAGETEMLFNMTQSGLPDIRAIRTSTALLERCNFWEKPRMVFGRISCALLSALAFNSAVVLAVTVPVVDLGYAKYSGTFNETTKTTQFLGIRFAAPPTGALRWQPPHPPATTPGIQLATKEPAACLPAAFPGIGMAPETPFRPHELRKRDSFSTSEDCLFLNVYLPEQLSQKKRLPVVVWIHGGGYDMGSASGFTGTDFFDGRDLIRESNNGVVVVIIQYRLGVFGFLPGKKVKKDGALNAGLLDQQFALQWVQKYIRKFNGDPTQVTIWGESSGAGSVLQHVIANGGETSPPLFRAAITSSTFLPSQYGYGDRIPEILYNEVVSQTNCSSAPDTLACLRTVDVQILEAANTKIGASGFYGTFVFVPVVDGELVRERPTEALKRRKVNGDVILTATNTFEGSAFIDPKTPENVDVGNYVAQLFPNFGAEEVAAAVAQYQSLGSPLFQLAAIMGEAIFICPTYFLLRAFGGRGFKSEFAIPPGGHGSDVAYYFPLDNVPPFADPDFVKAFSQSFLDFAITLNPNVKSGAPTITPKWPTWAGETEMLFNKTEGGLPDIRAIKTSRELLERCNFWESVGTLSGQ
ncbi:Alpha/Beta hydrolase protein [Lyophyllum atratum]|nr:Alpha/Beta hydrolase protein [Lyophyllum atratum]